MIRLEMKNYNKILTEKLQKILALSSQKPHNMNILQGNKYYLPIEAK